MGQEQTAGPSETIALSDGPGGLAQRLAELSQARFDLRCKAFGVPEVLQAINLAHDLRIAAARLEGDEEAELTAIKELHRELEKIAAAVEKCCQGIAVPVVDRELIRYRIEESAALAAEHTADKTVEIECRRKAVAAAEDLQRALMAASEAEVLSLAQMLELSWHAADARIALIDVTTGEPAVAQQARAVVFGELLKLADESLQVVMRRYDIGLALLSDVELTRAERSRIAVRFAREQGDREEELRALEQISDVEETRFAHLRAASGGGRRRTVELENTLSRLADAQADLEIARHRHKAEDAGVERKRQLLLGIRRATSTRLKAELERASSALQRWKAGYQVGVCSEFAVVESAARRRLAEIRLRQCEMELARLRKGS
jgi:hypothetical protein